MSLKYLLALPLMLLVSNVASAAFSFRISPVGNPAVNAPANTDVSIGGNQTFDLYAVKTTGPASLTFTLSNAQISYLGFDSDILISASLINGPTGTYNFTANNANSIKIGTITANVGGGASVGDFSNASFVGTIAATSVPGQIPLVALSSNSVQITAVPEPTSLALVGLSGLGYAFYRKRRAAKA